MVTCEACGKEIPEGNAFCTSCGAVLTPPTDYSRTGTPERLAEKPVGIVSWSRKIPLITNPWLVLQCIFIPLGIGLVMGSFLSLITRGEWDLLILMLILGAGLGVLMLIIMLVLQSVTGGGLETEFFISDEGVAHKAGGTTRTLDRVSAGGSAVLGSLSGTGAGLLAMSQENNVLAWDEVRYVSVYRSVRSIVFRSKYLISPVVLYCTDENFPQILAMVKKYAPPIATARI
ncbi:MAG: zinc ribbon domain-containing protein [Methanoregula sp.]|nr:zinc ribbon domain-containing protein [Methanoregula sp.]